VAQAQSSAADQVTLFLAKQGYAVLGVDNFPDANGQPIADAIYVLMKATSSNLDSQEMALQAAWGFAAVRRHYPQANTLISAMQDRQYLILFFTDAPTFDRFLAQSLPAQEFWNGVRANVRIFDTARNVMVSEKDFTGGSQTNKPFDPSFTPNQPACSAPPGEAFLLIRNNYLGKLMRFTIGGGEWGTHDYDVPGDGQTYIIRMPPGRYTYTAHIAGTGTAHGEPFQYNGGTCYPLTFAP
jgi:hypothetical protein